MFQNNYWNLIKLLYTALMLASRYDQAEVAKILLEQDEIDVNVMNIYLFLLMFLSIIRYFEIIIGILLYY